MSKKKNVDVLEMDDLNPPYDRDIVDVLKDNIIIYSKSTFDRAIPSAFDGLKPVQRRAVYVAYKSGLVNTPMKVSKLVGLVMGYHPHGDASIASTIVRMAQDTVLQNRGILEPSGSSFGNNYSLKAPAPRYIETRISNFGRDAMCKFLNKGLDLEISDADFNVKEPKNLPSALPLILVNGAMGVAEAFGTSIPQHNIADVADMTVKYIKNKNISPKGLVKGLKPDFRSGGIVINGDEIGQAYYDAGKRDVIKLRSDTEIDTKNNRIYIYSAPYGLDLISIKTKIWDLKTKTGEKNKNLILNNITFIGDKSTGNKASDPSYLFIDCRPNSNLVEILDELYKRRVGLETSYGIDLKVNVNGKIKKATIKDIIAYWYEFNYRDRHGKMVIDINTLSNKLHVLKGLLKVNDRTKELVNFLTSTDKGEAEHKTILRLSKLFDITLKQAKAIYDMKISSLTGRSKSVLVNQIESTEKELLKIRESLKNIDSILIKDILDIKNKYGWERRTKIDNIDSSAISSFTINDGAVFSNKTSIAVFNMNNVFNIGNKLLNGAKSYKINGEWDRTCNNHSPIDREVTGVVVFYSNGTYSVQKIQVNNAWFIDKNVNDNVYITCAVPYYDNDTEYIAFTNENKLKRFIINSRPSRAVKCGSTVLRCEPINSETSTNLVLASRDGYVNMISLDEISITSIISKGVIVGKQFKEGTSIKVIDKEDTNIVLHTMCTKVNNTHIVNYLKDAIEVGNRTIKGKLLVPDSYIIEGVSSYTVPSKPKDVMVLFYGKDSTWSVKYTGIRSKSGEAKKTRKESFGLSIISE